MMHLSTSPEFRLLFTVLRQSVLWRALPTLIVCLTLIGCSTNPTTGRRQFNALSRDQEIALGTQSQPEMIQEFGGAVPDASLQAYIADIGKRMAATTEADNPSLPWEFTLLNSDVINAFALPGGKIFFSKGLAKEMTNEAQVAAVVGHEIGHVTARHTNDRYARVMGAQVGLGVAGILLDGTSTAAALPAGEQLLQMALMSYDRKQELEADELGMRYMTRVGYDPIGAIEVQEILKRASGDGAPPEFLSTHPAPETRIARLQERISQYNANPPAGGWQKNEAQFKSKFHSRLALFPTPTPAPIKPSMIDRFTMLTTGKVPGNRRGVRTLNFADPRTWCGHCSVAAHR